MKAKITTLASLAAAALLLAPSLRAQTDVSLDPEFGARVAVSLDKKLAKGLHLHLEEELRMDQNFTAFDRFHTTLGATWKVHPNVKLGLGYAMINPYSPANKAFKNSRHRLMLDATGSLHLGPWRLSLKERLQMTFRTGDFNAYQTPQPLLALKSRLKLQYKGWRRFEPYAYVELRNTLNAPAIAATYDGTYYLTSTYSQYGDAGWFISGFDQAYLDRLRGALGVEYRLDKRNSLEACLLADWCIDKVVDANAAGTKLKSYTREQGFVGWVTVGYTYAF